MQADGLVRRISLHGAPHYVLADWRADGQWLLGHLLGNTKPVRDCGCMLWVGPIDQGRLTVKVDGERVNVRRAIWRLSGKRPLKRSETIRVSCDDEFCVAPAHMHAVSAAKADLTGVLRPAHVRARIAEAKRAGSAIDMAAARLIAASDEPEGVLARRYGISAGMVGRIRRGQNWLEYAGPLGQMSRSA